MALATKKTITRTKNRAARTAAVTVDALVAAPVSLPITVTSGGPAPTASLSEQAYQQIKQKILSLEFRPGQFLNELAICGMLQLSRTPVHHAVHRLMLEGLIDIIPRKGLLIRPDSMNEILNVLEARAALEPNIAALAAERATPAQIEQMEAMLAESALLKSRQHSARLMEIDRAFHVIIAAAAANPVLADLLRPLHERSGRLWHLQLALPDDLQRTQAEHAAILQAIVLGDKTAAAKAMQQHLASLRRRRIMGGG